MSLVDSAVDSPMDSAPTQLSGRATAVDASQDHQHHAAGDVDGDLRVP